MTKTTLRQIFATPGVVRHWLGLLTVLWLFYATSSVATNVYITYWLTHYRGLDHQRRERVTAGLPGGVGFFFYILGGWMGERWGRRDANAANVAATPAGPAFKPMRSPGPILQSSKPILPVSLGPFIGCWARNLKSAAQLADGLRTRPHLAHQIISLLNLAFIFPRHMPWKNVNDLVRTKCKLCGDNVPSGAA